MEKSPDAFRTISEVAEWLETPAHVLRFWESRFTQVKPVKRAGGRRYYRPSDMALLGGIKKLLHDDGLTIRGVQKILRTEGVRYVAALSPMPEDGSARMEVDAAPETRSAEVLRLGDPVPPERPQPAENRQAVPADEAPASKPAEPPSREPAGEPEVESDEEFAAALARKLAEDRPEPPAEARPAAATPEPGLDTAPEEHDDFEPEFAFDPDSRPGRPPPAAPLRAESPETAATPIVEPASPPPPVPRAPADLSRIEDGPEDDDPAYDLPRSPFPLRDRTAARARLAASPAKAAALFARLVELRERIGGPRR